MRITGFDLLAYLDTAVAIQALIQHDHMGPVLLDDFQEIIIRFLYSINAEMPLL